MRHVFVCVAIIAFLAIGGGCQKVDDAFDGFRARGERQRVKEIRAVATGVAENLLYLKDTRTNICFAYYWGGSAYGGPALTTVPCEVVSPHLFVAK